MSNTKYIGDLCSLLVRETYGELASRIFALLLRRGRQPLNAIRHHTGLNGKQLRNGLVVLVQQNLLYHNTERDTGVTYYEANEEAAYFLLRPGKILEIIEERYGSDAKDICQNLLLLGHTKVQDLADAYESKTSGGRLVNGGDGSAATNGHVNGNGASHEDSEKKFQLDGILARLLDDGFLEPVVEGMFKSPTDIYHEAEKEALRNDASGSKGAKATAMLKLTVAETLRRRREQRSWNGGTIKRTMNGTYTNGEKRRKLMNGKAATGEKVVFDEDIQLDRNLVVRLNYEKCTVALRTQSLAGLVATDIGDVTSQVYTEALRILEAKTPRCRPDPIIDGQPQDGDEDAGPTITVSTVAGSLSSNVNVSKGIGHVSSEKPDVETLANGNGKRRREEEDDEDDSEDDIVAANGRRSRVSFDSAAKGVSAEGRQARLSHLKDHLLLLSGHSQGLLKKISNDGLGEFVVPYGRVVSYLKEKELDTYIAAAFGKEGLRLSHVLRKFGKLDEKQIQKIALMKQGEVRKVLLRMQMHGFADIQEVPKDASRAPGRTVFLWWFDMDRVIKLMLEILYKTLCRCLEVLEVSRYEARDALALAGRDDVKGNEDEMLPENYLREFRAFQMKEEQLVIQMTRLDELVAIFRDY